jgi:hypothetical protein
LAACTPSIASVRIVLMHVVSSGWSSDFVAGLGSTAVAMVAFSFDELRQKFASLTL